MGIAFVKGIQLSKKIKIATISAEDQYNYLSLKTKDLHNGNNQWYNKFNAIN